MLDVDCGYSNHLFEQPFTSTNPIMLELERFVAHVGMPLEGDGLLIWLAARQPMRNLRTLSVGPCNIYLIGRTLRALGSNLDSLNLQTETVEGQSLPHE